MNTLINRFRQTRRSTTGRLFLDDMSVAVTLEPPREPDPGGNGKTCIQAGTYPLRIRWSPKHARLLPHVESVPGRTEIEHHVGNFPDDTEGCALIGRDFGEQQDYVSHSTVAFTAWMALLFSRARLTNPGSEEKYQVWDAGTITYTDPPLKEANE